MLSFKRKTVCPSIEKLDELYCEKNMTSAEIAKIYDVSPSTVRGWIYRARKKQKEVNAGEEKGSRADT